MAHDPAQIRNVTVLGHRGTGKTSLVEALLFVGGTTTRLGSVAEGTTVSDFDEEERRRTMSITASLSHVESGGVKVNLIDTPGESSFHADTLASLRAADSALMVVNATAGVEVQTERLWEKAGEAGLARAVVVNMMDRDRASFSKCMEALKELSPGVVAVQIPVGEESGFEGVVNLVSMTATTYDGVTPNGTTGAIPESVAAAADEAREALVESVAEADDALIEKYLEGEEITTEELIGGLCAAILEGRLQPVLCAAASKGGAGADRVLDLIVEGLPSPAAIGKWPATNGDGEPIELQLATDGPAVAYCFKTLADQFSGKINLLRVFSGTLPSDSQVVDSRTGSKERVGQLFTLQGKEHVPLGEIGPGDIGAVSKLKDVTTGDVLTTGAPISIEPVQYPAAVMSFAVAAKASGDDDKVVSSLRRLAEEDPTLDLHRDDETGDLIVAGLSQMHVEVVVDKLNRRFGVEVDLKPPRVPYKETITAAAEAEGKHKKQTGGRGQFGDCWIRIEPQPHGEGFEFVDKIVGGAIPRPFIPAVEKGVVEAMEAGPIGGFPVVDVKVTLYDGKYHAVDSSEMAFKMAGILGMRAALEKARPVLLEPIMMVEVTVPEEQVGDVMGDLSGRRGRPLGMEARGHSEVVRAEVPMAEMLTYAPDLRAMTGGRGDYTMEFLRYEQVPAHLAEKAAEAFKADA